MFRFTNFFSCGRADNNDRYEYIIEKIFNNNISPEIISNNIDLLIKKVNQDLLESKPYFITDIFYHDNDFFFKIFDILNIKNIDHVKGITKIFCIFIKSALVDAVINNYLICNQKALYNLMLKIIDINPHIISDVLKSICKNRQLNYIGVEIIPRIFELLQHSEFSFASNAPGALDRIFEYTDADVLNQYFDDKHTEFFIEYRNRLASGNYFVQCHLVELINNLLQERKLIKFKLYYISDVENLKFIMTLMIGDFLKLKKASIINFSAFVFLSGSNNPNIGKILGRNQDKLIGVLEEFKQDIAGEDDFIEFINTLQKVLVDNIEAFSTADQQKIKA